MDPFLKGVAITIASASGAHTCLVKALKSLFNHVQSPPKSPLFMQDDGVPMSQDFLISQVRSGLMLAGFYASKFSGHSFCCGTASLAAMVGFNNYEIQPLGRWCSNSYKLYVDSSQARLVSLSSHLHWAIPHNQAFEPPSLHFPLILA